MNFILNAIIIVAGCWNSGSAELIAAGINSSADNDSNSEIASHSRTDPIPQGSTATTGSTITAPVKAAPVAAPVRRISSIVVSPSNTTYYRGESLVLNLKSNQANPFNPYDEVYIVDEDVEPANYRKEYVDYSYSRAKKGEIEFTWQERITWRIGKFRAAFFFKNNRGPNASGVSDVFEVFDVKANSTFLTTDKSQYAFSADVSVEYQSNGGVFYDYSDRIYIVKADALPEAYCADSVNYRWIGDANWTGTGGAVVFRAAWGIGTYKAVLTAFECRLVYAVSDPFEIVQHDVLVKASKRKCIQGSDIVFTLKSNDGIPFRRYDYYGDRVDGDDIYIVRSNVMPEEYLTDVYLLPLHLWNITGATTVSQSVPVTMPVGKYRAVFVSAEFSIVYAASPVFQVLKNKAVLTLSKSSYYQGEDLVMYLNSSVGVPFAEYDYVAIFHATATVDEYRSTFGVIESFLYGDSVNTTMTHVVPINWVHGEYKAVFLLDKGLAICAVSTVFQVLENTAALTIDEPAYYQGAPVVVSFKSNVGVPFSSADKVCIVQNWTGPCYYKYGCPRDCYYLGNESDVTEGSITIPAARQVVGPYRAVIAFQDSWTLFGVSDWFKVLKNNATITSDKETYRQGEDLVLTFQSDVGVPFDNDRAFVIPDSVKPINYRGKFRARMDIAGSTTVIETTNISWSAGKYKAVLFLGYDDYSFDSRNLLGVSNVFEVM